jgi:hypothetical protein
MTDIRELAVKHGAITGTGKLEDGEDESYLAITPDQLLSFTNEYAAMLSSEPVAWVFYADDGYAIMTWHLYGSIPDDMKNKVTPLFKANPINQSLIDEVKRLRGSIDSLFDKIKHGDKEHQEWLKDALLKHFDESPANLKDLIGE